MIGDISVSSRNIVYQKDRKDKIMISQGLRVLYAEDNEDARYLLTMALKFSGVEVVPAATVAEALQLGQTEYFDIYLLDSRFSDGNGVDLCRSLREKRPHAPILFYSGDAYATDVQKGMSAGANAYFVKPYFDTFIESILEIIEQKLSKAYPVKYPHSSAAIF